MNFIYFTTGFIAGMILATYIILMRVYIKKMDEEPLDSKENKVDNLSTVQFVGPTTLTEKFERAQSIDDMLEK